MTTHVRFLAMGAALALAAGFFVTGSKADDDKNIKQGLLKLADALEKQDADGATKLAAEVGKGLQLEDIMHFFALRKGEKGGLGIGPKPGAMKPDGIEAKIIGMAKRAPNSKELDDHGSELARAMYVTAAIGKVIADQSPVQKKTGKKDPKDWKVWSEEMEKAALDAAEAIKSKAGPKIKTAASKLEETCTKCHEVFRE